MKNYRGFYREAKGNLPHIYCDMDGVLTDFVLAAKRATGQNWEEKSTQLLSSLKIKADLKVVQSEDPLASISELSSEFDLLVLGAPEQDSWINVLLGSGRDKFTESAACSVLRITMKN